MKIRQRAEKSYYGVTAKDIIKNATDGEDYIIEINNQNYICTPYLHESDSDNDDDLHIANWGEATYIHVVAQYINADRWLSTGLDNYAK